MKHLLSYPVYKAVFDENEEDSGVQVISFVDEPAIMVDGIALAKDKEQLKFATLEKEQAFLAPVLIPDLKIYRETMMGEPYYIMFEKDIIKKLAYKFMKQKLTDVTNIQHQESTINNKSYIVESTIIANEEMQTAFEKLGLEKLPLGTWVVKYKVNDPETYNLLATNKLRGLSVEVFVDMELNKLSNNLNKSKMKKESKFKKILAELTSLLMEVQLANYVLADGSLIETAEDGTVLTPVDIADGEYQTADGEVLVVSGKKVIEVKPAPVEEAPKVEIEVPMAVSGQTGTTAPVAPEVPASSGATDQSKKEKMMEVKTVDGTTLFIDEITGQVSVIQEDGSYIPAPEGEHVLEDGTVIVIDAEGKLIEKMSKSVKDKMTQLNATITDLHNKLAELEAKLSSTPAVSTPIGFKKAEETTDYSKLTVAQRAALAAIARKNGGVK